MKIWQHAVQITPQQMQCKSRHSKCSANHATANAVEITPQQMQHERPKSGKLQTLHPQTANRDL